MSLDMSMQLANLSILEYITINNLWHKTKQKETKRPHCIIENYNITIHFTIHRQPITLTQEIIIVKSPEIILFVP